MVEREKLPNRKLRGSKQVGEKMLEREKLPNRKLRGIKRVGAKMFKQEEILQSERVENQADWG